MSAFDSVSIETVAEYWDARPCNIRHSARPVGTRNPDPLVARLEDELKELLNETGIGPMGLGGDVTVLQCHVEHADTHMTLNPVAVNYQCWAARRATAHVGADGSVDFDREA